MAKPKTTSLRTSIRDALVEAGDQHAIAKLEQTPKKNYAEALSRRLASIFADALRPNFKGILPDPNDTGHESKARTSKGFKKLDVNYSKTDLGLALGLSIKTINFKDRKTNRYTKNYTRVDAELRAEASDYHDRQPYAVMIAVIFMPMDSCEDSSARIPSSFGQAVQIFRNRAGRKQVTDASMLFEGIFIGLYDAAPGAGYGDIIFFDVSDKPTRSGKPQKIMAFTELISRITGIYDLRNQPLFEWDDAPPEAALLPPAAAIDEDEEGT
jgi:hypothetical protein